MSKKIHPLLREMSPALSVGILTADLMRLEDEVRLLEQNGVKAIHFDVMDGHFASPLTVGVPFVKGLRTTLLKDVHLMVGNPLEVIPAFADAGADMITVHVEATAHIHQAMQDIGRMPNANDPARGIARGLALNPGTSLSVIPPLLQEIDIVWLLAVNPAAPQKVFVESTKERLGQLREMLRQHQSDVLIGIDGGVKRENIEGIAALGADLVVSGSAIFDGKAAADNMRFMLQALHNSAPSLPQGV